MISTVIFKRTLTCLSILVLIGCATSGSMQQRIPPHSVAIVGVTLAPGVESGKSLNAMSRELQELIHGRGGYQTLRSTEVERAVNSVAVGAYKAMVGNYSRNGELHGNDLRTLSAARLPVQTALILRVEKNDVRAGAPKRLPMRSNAGKVLSDRERIVLSTVREMQLRASMINVATGNTVWSRSYRSTPAAESSYVHYSGSSFSGSLAASFANTMTNGLRVPAGPVPPSNHLTLRSLMQEVVRNLPRN